VLLVQGSRPWLLSLLLGRVMAMHENNINTVIGGCATIQTFF